MQPAPPYRRRARIPSVIRKWYSQRSPVEKQKSVFRKAAVKAAIHRLRQRFQELVRKEIAHTVGAPGDVDDELHYMDFI